MDLDFLKEKLRKREREGNLRILPRKQAQVAKDFVSNDYLSLSCNDELSLRIRDRLGSLSFAENGGTGSRLLSGNHPLYDELENYLRNIFHGEVLVFNSGYAANQGVVSAVAGKGDTILYDVLSHVCLKEGAWLSGATTISFRHNDMEDLREKLARAEGRVFVLTEAIFSMDGDIAPLHEITTLCQSAGAFLIVDEAHSTGVYGKGGAGMMVELGLQDLAFARVYTFGKGMGVHGACVVGDPILINYLINFSRTLIYTTSLPPHSVLSILESFRYLSEHPELPEILRTRIDFFKSQFPPSQSLTAIQPVMLGSNVKARNVATTLQAAGYDVRSVLAPTVKKGTERLRISLHTHNSEPDIAGLVETLTPLL